MQAEEDKKKIYKLNKTRRFTDIPLGFRDEVIA